MGQVISPTPEPVRSRAIERTFLPAELELLETPPSPTLRVTAWTLMALLVGSVSWACLSEIEIVATAPGRLVPAGEVKVVQPLETSVVKGIHVAEGDHVEAGQVLIDLDPTEASADLESTRTEHMQALLDAEAARLLLSEVEDPVISPLPDVAESLLAATQTQVRLQLTEHRAGMRALHSEVADKQAALVAKGMELRRNAELLPLAEDRYATQKGLFDRGNASKINLLQAQYDLIDKKTDSNSLPQQVQQLHAEISGLEHKISQEKSKFLREAAEQQIKAMQKIYTSEQLLKKQKERELQKYLKAPVSGIVQSVKTHTISGVVKASDNVVTIVPDYAPLEVESYIDHKDIGFVKTGQNARIKLEAFPFTKYGTVDGRLIKINQDANQSENHNDNNFYDQKTDIQKGYKSHILINDSSIMTENGLLKLRAGMIVQADIITGKRRIIEYILDPISKIVLNSAHEK